MYQDTVTTFTNLTGKDYSKDVFDFTKQEKRCGLEAHPSVDLYGYSFVWVGSVYISSSYVIDSLLNQLSVSHPRQLSLFFSQLNVLQNLRIYQKPHTTIQQRVRASSSGSLGARSGT
jgi:hypothetical protein